MGTSGTWGRILRSAATCDYAPECQSLLRNGVPLRRPHVPRFLPDRRRNVGDEAHAIPVAQQFYLGPFGHRNHIDAMALVCLEIEAFAEDSTDPAIGDRSNVVGTVPLIEPDSYIGYTQF